MVELKLKFTDERHLEREVLVTGEQFSIGRTPDNNLAVANAALSRKHAEINRFGDVFVISDAGSSNGTELNGRELTKPAALCDGDEIMLGGAVRIIVELRGQTMVAVSSGAANNGVGRSSPNSSLSAAENAFVWQNFYLIAPVLVVVVLTLVGVLLVTLNWSGRSKSVTAELNREQASEDDQPNTSNHHRNSPRNRNSLETENNDNDDPAPVDPQTKNENTENSNNNSGTEPANTNSNKTSASSSENEIIERLALQFLRQISANQNPVLKSEQIALISAKIKSLRNSVAFRDNLRAATKNTASFEKIGQTHNLKGALLAAAALAKLNDARGDAAATAAAIAPDLQKYSLVLGNELANDNLLAVAAYAEGNPPNAFRDRVANLTLAPGASAATVRTIWFLHDNNKLGEPAFDFAVRFLAAGTILQNPSAFNF